MFKKFFNQVANLKIAILLLLIIAICSGLGSVIEQDKELEFYQTNYSTEIKIIHLKLFELIVFFGFNHLYTTNWFFLLVFGFALCLISCTFLHQFPTLKFARKYFFYKKESQLKKLNSIKQFQVSNFFGEFNFLLKNLNQFQYLIFQQLNTFYAYKGLIGRIAPIIVHLSIIGILYGGLIGSLVGFTAQEFIPKTEIFHVQNITKAGFLSYLSPQSFRLNDFWIEYNKKNAINQFYSNISVLAGSGNEFLYKTISVNNPLTYKNLVLYQTDWGLIAVRINVLTNNKIILQFPLYEIQNLNKKVWLSWLTENNNNSSDKWILLLLTKNQVQLYNQNNNFISVLNIHETINLKNLEFLKLIDIIGSTGIQIKLDQGIFLIYLGFFMLILSSLLSYISFSEIWGLKLENSLLYVGKTNRAKLKISMEFEKLK